MCEGGGTITNSVEPFRSYYDDDDDTIGASETFLLDIDILGILNA